MPQTTVYTVNFGDYDTVFPPACVDHPYFCFVGEQGRGPERSAWRTVARKPQQSTPRLESRWHKIHAHLLFPHAEWTLYHDASLQLHRCPLEFLAWCREATKNSDADLYLFEHPERDCLYEEAKVCIELEKDTREKIEPHVAKYREMKFPEHMGLWFAGVLLRRNTPAAKRFNEMWWWELINGSHRDQVSLPVVLHYSEIRYATLADEFLSDWFAWRADHTGRKGT